MHNEDGIEIDETILIGVLQNKVAQMAMREAQLEAAVQQLRQEMWELSSQVMKDPVDVQEEGPIYPQEVEA